MPQEYREAKSPLNEEQTEREKAERFLRTARERFKLAVEAEHTFRDKALDDFRFSIGDQWPADIETDRNLDGRPILTMNRIPQFKRQITNEQRQQKPSIQINPVGSQTDVETAEVLQGCIRHIEVQSNADIADDISFDHMVTMGRGWQEVVTRYANDKSFDQEIYIVPKRNPFAIYPDPSAIEVDKSDMSWAFEVEDLYAEQFRSEWTGQSAYAGLNDFTSIGDTAPGWATKDTIRVAKYWHVEETPKNLHELEDGTIVEEAPEGVKVSRTRKVLDRRVICSIINGVEVLEEYEWSGDRIPLFPVVGDEEIIDGKLHCCGLVRYAKDPQRMYNYWQSAATETIALAPRAPFIGAKGQFENFEGQWRQANVRSFPYLEYSPVSVAGQPVPPPQRQVYEPPIQAMSAMVKLADNDLKATTGIYDASLGQQGPEQSGRAIVLRQNQGQVSNLHWIDNLGRTKRSVGKELLVLIRRIYDAPRVQRIINPDGEVRHVGIFSSQNTPTPDAQGYFEAQGIQKIFDIGVGEYDVTVSVGPSYQTKRQEAVATELSLVQSFPQAFPVIGDLIVKNMDIPESQTMAARLKKMLPPNLQGDDEQDPQMQMQQLQAQLQQMAAQHQVLMQELQKATETIKTDAVSAQSKQVIAQMEIQSRERIAAMQTQAELVQTQAKIRSDNSQALLDAQIRSIHETLGHVHEQVMQKRDHAADIVKEGMKAEAAQEQAKVAAKSKPNGSPKQQ